MCSFFQHQEVTMKKLKLYSCIPWHYIVPKLTQWEKKIIKFLPKVNNSINVNALSFFSSLLFTHSPRLRTNVFLIFSSSVASQACGRGEAGMTDKSGIVSPDDPSRAVTWRRWATAKNPIIKTPYDYAKWFSIFGRKTSSTYCWLASSALRKECFCRFAYSF